MSTDVLDFAAARVGQYVRSPVGLGGQCVDLVEVWAAHLGAPAVPGNAVDLLRNAPNAAWQVELNGPTNYPPVGAIVVWGEDSRVGIGPYGHTAVCLAADPHWLLTLDQNWPPGRPVGVVLHSYMGVHGWLIHKG